MPDSTPNPSPPPDWIRTIVAALVRSPHVDAVTGSGFFTDGDTRWRSTGARLYLGAHFAAAALALTHVPLFGSNFAMRCTAWRAIRHDVHTCGEDIHDDFDVSFHLGHRHRIRYLRRLRLGISGRPLTDGEGQRRMKRGLRTVTLHWPREFPWLRLTRRIIHRLSIGERRKDSTLGGQISVASGDA